MRKILDYFYSLLETYGGKISNWSWNKRCTQRYQIEYFCQVFCSAIQSSEMPLEMPAKMHPEIQFEIPPEILLEVAVSNSDTKLREATVIQSCGKQK